MKQRIDGTITRPDGQVVSFAITSEGTAQWGLAPSEMGDTVDLLGALTAAVRDEEFFTEPEAER